MDQLTLEQVKGSDNKRTNFCYCENVISELILVSISLNSFEWLWFGSTNVNIWAGKCPISMTMFSDYDKDYV